MKSKIVLIPIVILIIVAISLILAIAEFKLFGTYVPLDISTFNMTLGIITVTSYDVSGVPLSFGNQLGPDSIYNPATSAVNVNNTGNTDLNISIRGSEFFNHTLQPTTYYFSIGNVAWSDVNVSGTSTRLTSNYVNVGLTDFGDDRDIFFWVDIPPAQYTGSYESTLYIEVIAA